MKKPRLKMTESHSEPILFRVSPKVKTKLRVKAAQKGVSMSDFVRKVMTDHIEGRSSQSSDVEVAS